jgi:hypothetical protein
MGLGILGVGSAGAFCLSPSRTWYSLSTFIAMVGAVLLIRPACVFRPDGGLYGFGCGPDRSVFSFSVLTSFAAVVSSFGFALRDLMA